VHLSKSRRRGLTLFSRRQTGDTNSYFRQTISITRAARKRRKAGGRTTGQPLPHQKGKNDGGACQRNPAPLQSRGRTAKGNREKPRRTEGSSGIWKSRAGEELLPFSRYEQQCQELTTMTTARLISSSFSRKPGKRKSFIHPDLRFTKKEVLGRPSGKDPSTVTG